MLGRFFERLQHRIECVARQHVHFIDDVYLETTDSGYVERVFQKVAHVIDLRVRRRIELYQVYKAPAVNRETRAALTARRCGDTGFAIKRFCDDARERGFADAARAGKQISVMKALPAQRIRERSYNVLLPDQLIEGLGTPLARENLTHF